MIETDYTRERDELTSQIRILLEQIPSLSALRAAQYILKVSIPAADRVLSVLRTHTCEISSHLPFKDLISFSQVCTATRSWREHSVLDHIHVLLQRFVSDPNELRNIMRRNNSVISGSSVMWLLEGFPATWSPGDLDIYCPRYERGAIVYFFKRQGYEFVDPLEEEEEGEERGGYGSSFLSTAHLSSVKKMKKGDSRVDILESTEDGPLEPLKFSHTSTTMNYITWNKIVALYPLSTFQKVGIVQDGNLRGSDAWIDKYTNRSYKVEYPASIPHNMGIFCPKLLRWNGDKYALTIRFDPAKLTSREPSFNWKFNGGNSYHNMCTAHRCIAAGLKKGLRDVCIEQTMLGVYNEMLRLFADPMGASLHKEEWLRTRIVRMALELIRAAQGGTPVQSYHRYTFPSLDLSHTETCDRIKSVSANGAVVLEGKRHYNRFSRK